MKSLKSKFIVLTVVLIALTLGLFSSLAYFETQDDKRSYVIDSVKLNVDAIADRITLNFDRDLSQIRLILRDLNQKTLSLGPLGQSLLENDQRLHWMAIFESRDGGQSFELKTLQERIKRYSEFQKNSLGLQTGLLKKSIHQSPAIFLDPTSKVYWMAISVVDQREQMLAVLTEIKREKMGDEFLVPAQALHYLLDTESRVILGPEGGSGLNPQLVTSTVEDLKKNAGWKDSQTFEVHMGDRDWLGTRTPVVLGGFSIFSLVPKSYIEDTSGYLSLKTVLLALALFGLSLLIVVVGTAQITKRLEALTSAMHNVAKGEFGLQVQVAGADEVGTLAQGFNRMSEEIQGHILQKAEAARMETELKTAKTVQATLFPKGRFEDSAIQICGYYESASECSGDWWSYSQVDGKYFLWIGDATGHGVSAALVTAAVMSASVTTGEFGNLDAQKIMEIVNKAVCGTSHGFIMMTLFLGIYDPKRRKLSYVNASHEQPFLISPSVVTKPIKRKDFDILLGPASPRLGQGTDSEYTVSELDLKPGDILYFYTDGVSELKNSEGEDLGERRMMAALAESYNNTEGLDAQTGNFLNSILNHRLDESLNDDLTFFFCQFK